MSSRTYIPTQVVEAHKLAVFMAKWNSVLRPAILSLDPSALSSYDALFASITAFDAFAQTLYPLGD